MIHAKYYCIQSTGSSAGEDYLQISQNFRFLSPFQVCGNLRSQGIHFYKLEAPCSKCSMPTEMHSGQWFVRRRGSAS